MIHRQWFRSILVIFTLLLVVIGSLSLASPSRATPGSGVTAEQITSGDLSSPVQASFKDGSKVKTDVSRIVMTKYTVTPGGYFGWHQHSGPVWVVVASGTLTYYGEDDPSCTGIAYAAGSTFMDSGNHTHNARNEGSENVVIYATFQLPEGGAVRIDVPDPGNCDF
jgi:quercetin dioxygenase-like cupin family protein